MCILSSSTVRPKTRLTVLFFYWTIFKQNGMLLAVLAICTEGTVNLSGFLLLSLAGQFSSNCASLLKKTAEFWKNSQFMVMMKKSLPFCHKNGGCSCSSWPWCNEGQELGRIMLLSVIQEGQLNLILLQCTSKRWLCALFFHGHLGAAMGEGVVQLENPLWADRGTAVGGNPRILTGLSNLP